MGAPPLDEFWGEWVTSEGDYLSLIYPRRDEAIAERLAEDIDQQIADMCATLEDIDCSADLHLTVRLDYDPVSYTHLRAHETVLDLVCRLLLEKKKQTTAALTHTCISESEHQPTDVTD